MKENRKVKNLNVYPLFGITEKYEKKTMKIQLYYKKALLNILKIANEMKIENSFQLCVLFNYLLYEEYLTAGSRQNFGRDYIPTLAKKSYLNEINYSPFIIALGQGVCLNYSNMLNDLLLLKGYKSSVLICETDKIELTLNDLLRIKKHLPLLKINFGNHATVLINENNYLYMYDPTNFTMGTFSNHNKIDCNEYESGKVYHGLSLTFIKNFKSLYPLLKLYNIKKKEIPYNKEMIEVEYNIINNYFNDNYDNIEKYILEIENNAIMIKEEIKSLFYEEREKQLKKKR